MAFAFLRPGLKFDLSQVHNPHGAFARLIAPYPSAFIHRDAAGFVFFSFLLGPNSQEFQHLHSTRVSKRRGKKTTEFLPTHPRTSRLTSEGWCNSDAKRGAAIAKTLPVHQPCD